MTVMSSCESFTPCKVIQDSLGFHVLSTGFLELNSGFQSKGFHILEKLVASRICLTLYGVN